MDCDTRVVGCFYQWHSIEVGLGRVTWNRDTAPAGTELYWEHSTWALHRFGSVNIHFTPLAQSLERIRRLDFSCLYIVAIGVIQTSVLVPHPTHSQKQLLARRPNLQPNASKTQNVLSAATGKFNM